jgi:vitamin B12/bleomycin/antimicrobial peptide transport system ATP-binding/permease protein
MALSPRCGRTGGTVDRFDRVFWKGLWSLARPYWTSEKRARGMALLAVVVALSLGTIGMRAIFSYVSRDVMNSLQANAAAHFYHLMLLYVVWIVIFVPIAAFYPYLTGLLAIEWREWMTEWFVRLSLDKNALYRIMRDRSVDNPDQRISEDINSFTSGALTYSTVVLRAIVTAATFFGILWSISSWLAVCLVGYAALGTWLTIMIGRRLVVINFDQQRYEADYRFALVHARDNAEQIALYQGAKDEARQLSKRFAHLLRNFKLLLLWQRHLTFFTEAYDDAANLVPYFVLAGAYFSGHFKLGEFTQAAYAFAVLQSSLSLVIDRFQTLTDYASVVNRLAAFKTECEKADAPTSDGAERIEVVEDGRLAIESLTLMTPDRRRTLIGGVSAAVNEGSALLIKGPSGVGKTSLMRAVAGIWNFGSGRIERPPMSEIMFLPQRPYMILGTLRDQICYPRAGDTTEEEQLEVLKEVNLADLPMRFGGLDAEMPWVDVLSTGEQQRLAFARLLLNGPRYAFLDEATSAVDLENEELLYGRLARLPMTVVSLGHRPSLRKFHSQVLRLRPVTDSQTALENGARPETPLSNDDREDLRR